MKIGSCSTFCRTGCDRAKRHDSSHETSYKELLVHGKYVFFSLYVSAVLKMFIYNLTVFGAVILLCRGVESISLFDNSNYALEDFNKAFVGIATEENVCVSSVKKCF